jgi:tetratricopeptide (TPR) repeat protein
MEGRRRTAVAAAAKPRELVSDDMVAMVPGMDWYLSEEYSALVRFGMWDEILAKKPPNPSFQSLAGAYLYAKAMALASKGRVDEAKKVAAELEKLTGAVAPDTPAGYNSAKDVLTVATLISKARVAAAEKDSDRAISLYREAVAKEDQLAYDEPSDWFFPVRHLLGAELLKAGKAKEAEAVYRADLKKNPGNGWALFGLEQALRAQKKNAEAAKVAAELEKAWQNADVKLVASAY